MEGDNTCVERMKLSVQKDHTHPPKAGGWKPHQWRWPSTPKKKNECAHVDMSHPNPVCRKRPIMSLLLGYSLGLFFWCSSLAKVSEMFKHFRLLRPGVSILLMFFGSMLLLRNEVRGNWERKFPLNDSTSNVGTMGFSMFYHF